MDYLGFCIAFAVGIGVSMWVALESATLGMAIGAGAGIALWAGFNNQKNNKDTEE